MFKSKYHRYLFILGNLTYVFGLSLSPFLISLGSFILSGNLLLEFNYKQKFHYAKSQKAFLGITLIYAVHILWLLNTSNLSYALQDLKIKLPLLALPIIYGFSKPLTSGELKIILNGFLLSIIIASGISAYIYWGFSDLPPYDARAASIIISHIRFAILLVIAIMLCVWFGFDNEAPALKSPVVYKLTLAWLIFYLFTCAAFTGIMLLIFSMPAVGIYWLIKNKTKTYRFIAISFIITLLSTTGLYILWSINKFNTRISVDYEQLDQYSANGNKYIHLNKQEYENEYLTWIYYCPKELTEEWNTRSTTKIDSLDLRGQVTRHTLVRYLTSLGYRKDSLGLSKLSQHDIDMIEKGYSNHIFNNRASIYPRLYQLLWEIERYRIDGDPNGHSLTLRIEYFKNAINVIKRHFFWGTGTGDINDEILHQYKSDQSILKDIWQRRSHNQFISFFVSFGLFGSVAIVLSLFYTFYHARKNIDLFAFSFLVIVFLSMLTEDTLETQAGVSIASFFTCLLLIGRQIKPTKDV